MKTWLLLLAVAGVCATGCVSYQYRVVQPPGIPQVITKTPLGIHYDPLDYRLSREQDHLGVRIINPTEDRIQLISDRSYIVDPNGESHPIRGRAIAPHSYVWLLLPPVPHTYAYPDYSWGWGWGWGGYYPYWGPWYGGYWWPPPISYYQVTTPYDWGWRTGLVRVHLSFDRKGAAFEHDFEVIREEQK
jgi:hypothetical protein